MDLPPLYHHSEGRSISSSHQNNNLPRGPKHHEAITMVSPGEGQGALHCNNKYSKNNHNKELTHLYQNSSSKNHHGAMDSLHNDELPCCSSLQDIAQDVLPPLHDHHYLLNGLGPSSPQSSASLLSSSSRSFWNSGKDNKIQKSIGRNGHREGSGYLNSLNVPNSTGFVQFVQEFLWEQYRKRRQHLQQQEGQQQHQQRQISSPVSNESTLKIGNKKKRKKKKKKKSKRDDDGAEDMDEDNSRIDEEEQEEIDFGGADVLATVPASTTSDVSNSPVTVDYQSVVVDHSNGRLGNGPDPVLESMTMEQQSWSVKNPQQRINGTSDVSDRIATINASLKDRDWWIHCYLDRVAMSASKEVSASLASPTKSKITPRGIKDFLRVLAEKVQGEGCGTNSASSSCREGVVAATGSLTRSTKAMGNTHQQQQPSQDHLDIHISHKDLEYIALKVDCFACRSRLTNLLSNFSTIPLLPLNEMQTQNKGDGRRGFQNNNTLSINGGNTYNGNKQYDKDDESSVDCPFDYVAMEEGNSIQRQPNDEMEEDSERAILFLEAVKTEQGQTVGWRLQKTPLVQQSQQEHPFLTEEDFSFLLREVFLLPAISYDEWVGACDQTTLSAEKVKIVTDVVEQRYSNMLAELTNSMTELLEQQEKLNTCERRMKDGGISSSLLLYERHTTPNNFELTIPMTLSGIDSDVCKVLGKLLRIVLHVTHAYQDVMLQWNNAAAAAFSSNIDTSSSSSSRPSSCFPCSRFPSVLLGQVSSIVAMWSTYLNGHGQILQAMATFERELFQLAGSQGMLEAPFACQRSRHLLAEVVQAKIKIVLNAIEGVRKNLDQQQDVYHTPTKVYRPTFLRSILTQQVLLKEVRTNVTHGQQFSSRGEQSSVAFEKLHVSNEACEDVLHEIQDSWIEIVLQNSISQIEEVYETKRQKLERIFRTAKEKLNLKSKDIHWQGLDGFRTTTFMGEFLDQITTNDKRCIHDVLPILRSQLIPAVESMIEQWIIQSTASSRSCPPHAGLEMEQRNGQGNCPPIDGQSIVSPKPLIMPLRLIQWMSMEPRTESRSSSRCHGADASLRATCLIVTLLYRWFVEQFNEWQAELAEQELLLAMGDATDKSDLSETKMNATKSSMPGTTISSKKKHKKKRGKESQQQQKQDQITTMVGQSQGSIPTTTLHEENYVDTDTFSDDGQEEKIYKSTPLEQRQSASDYVKPLSSEGIDMKETVLEENKVTSLDGGIVAHDDSVISNELGAVTQNCIIASDTAQDRLVVSVDTTTTLTIAAAVEELPGIQNEQLLEGRLNEYPEPSADIGVLDGPSFVCAKAFLLKRLVDVWEGGENDNGFPFIHL